jgi:hypothetical protein
MNNASKSVDQLSSGIKKGAIGAVVLGCCFAVSLAGKN